MTIAEAERFYKQDTKKYDISKNKELLNWLKEVIKNGYDSFIDIDNLQELIDNIANWYEIKYPERELELADGTIYYNFENIEKLSKIMNLKQLLYRLPHEQLCLMECDYRSNGSGIRDIYNDKGEVIGEKTILYMIINIKHNSFLLYADTVSGKVDIDYNLRKYVNVDNITLDELLVLFKEKYNEELVFTKLEECIYDHNCDVELRRRILQLVALKLLYSNRTIPERGYERAKRFINEMNKKMGLNLSTEEIDVAISKDYTDDEKFSYCIVEDNIRKENVSLKKGNGLIKTLFKK